MKTLKITLELDITPDLIEFIDSYDTGAPTCANNYDEIIDWIADCPENLKEVIEYAKSVVKPYIPYTENYEIVTYCDANLKEVGLGG